MADRTLPKINRRTAVVSWLTIFTQAALPLSFAYSPLVQAASQEDAPKWYQSGTANPSLFEDEAGTLAMGGASLSQGNSADVAAGMARSAATGALNNSVEAWLSQFGTARVQLNLDDKFKAGGSEADLLVPLYDNDSTLLFSQLGFRHKDDRNTGNLGFGARHFVGDWMLGGNAFLDNDFTGENRRVGLGAEAWRDYLKLSVNGYFRLTDWHQSRDFHDYDERPANGYDLRAEGWLPAFPQLGAKLMYEQYQGDEVALFGKDNRQQDPWALTAGLTYTPVPLVTLGAQHRAGKEGQSDAQLNLQLNYRLGESWSKQLDPDLVGASRTLAGTRYDLVERNNSIVLEYRKQESVTLVLPEKIAGKGRETVPVTFSVQTKNPLQRIDWEAPTLLAAGGTLTPVGSSQLSITLPSYLPAGNNLYRIAGVAYDVNGNSGSATAEIQVQVGSVSVGSTRVSATPTSIAADGKSTSTLRVELVDGDGNPVPGQAKSLTASLKETLSPTKRALKSAPQAAKLGPVAETAPGIYQAVLTAGNRAGTVVVSSKFEKAALPDITITQSADAATGHIPAGAILATTDNSAANGAAVNTVTATVTDANNNRIPGAAVSFSLSGSASVAAGSSLSAVTDDKGLASVSFVSKVAETVTVTAALDNGNSGSVDTRFVADSSTAGLDSGAVTVDKATVVANNSDAATFSAVVKDANGNAVPNFTVDWSSDKGTLSAGSSNTDANGVATITLKHSVAEAAQVTAKAGSSTVSAPLVNFSADTGSAGIGSGDLSVDKTTLVANDTEIATYTALVKDANGNPVPGVSVEWQTDLGTLSGSSSLTDASGNATITLKGTKAGDAQVSAATNGGAAVNAGKVTFTADGSSASIGSGDLQVNKNILIANGTDAATFSATVKDAHGNPVNGTTVNWATSKGTLSGSTSTSGSDGVATITLSDTLIGDAQVTAQTGTSGNINAPSVSFIADNASATLSSGDVTVDKTSVVANNVDVATFSARVKDANGNPVPNFVVSWTTSKGTLSAGSTLTDANGLATVTLKDTLAGTTAVTAQSGSSASINAPAVDFTADSTTAAIGSGDLSVDKTRIVANNTDQATFTAVVKDASGNPVSGTTVTWATDLGAVTATSTTDSAGKATTTLKGTLAGNAQVTASVNGATPVNADKVTLAGDSATAAVGSGDISVDKTTLVANDSELATYKAIVKDANGNVVEGVTVNWTTDNGSLSGATSVTGSDGVASVTLKGKVAGDAQVAVKVGAAASVNAPVVKLIADGTTASIGSGDLTADKTTLVADNSAFVTYTAIVKDAGGNLVSGANVSWATDLGTLSAATSTTGADGKATVTLKGTLAGTAQVAATVNGAAANAPAVVFTADSSTASIGAGDLTVDKTTIVANNTELATYSALVKDANGNPTPNVSVSWATDRGSLSGSSSMTDAAGLATVTLKGTIMGAAQVIATVRSTPSDAPVIDLIADVTTAKVDTLTSSVTKITGTGAEDALQTATVKDAHGNLVENVDVTWATTKGTLSNATSKTDSTGKAVSTLTAIETGSTNSTATVTAAGAAGNQTVSVTLRAVLGHSGEYLWTMITDHDSADEGVASANCAKYGGGRLLNESDFDRMIAAKVDFKDMAVPNEYKDLFYRFGGQWTTKMGDIKTQDSTAYGTKKAGTGTGYICIK